MSLSPISEERKIHDGSNLAVKWQNMSVFDLWHSQVIRHHQETYRGIGIGKFPQDLWSYEKLLDVSSPEVIIEIGINEGGFTRWLHDRLLTTYAFDDLRRPRTVIGLDLNITNAQRNLSPLLNNPVDGVEVILIECDLLNPSSLEKNKKTIASIINNRPLLIIEDSGHSYGTTMASLNSFFEFVKPGEWFVVEDTCVDIDQLRGSLSWPRGALAATNDFLEIHQDFEQTQFNHAYEITCHPYGFLRRKTVA